MRPFDGLAVFGLGNPGLRYRFNRHNAGFLFLDWLAERLAAGPERRSATTPALVRSATLANATLYLVKPQTFMNLSGEAFVAFCKALGIPPSRTLVVYDDLALPFGAFRIRPGGSSGGHRGLASIIAAADTQSIPRFRIGIQGKTSVENAIDYVLADFTAQEAEELEAVFQELQRALAVVLQEGIPSAMNRFNRRPALERASPKSDDTENPPPDR